MPYHSRLTHRTHEHWPRIPYANDALAMVPCIQIHLRKKSDQNKKMCDERKNLNSCLNLTVKTASFNLSISWSSTTLKPRPTYRLPYACSCSCYPEMVQSGPEVCVIYGKIQNCIQNLEVKTASFQVLI